MISLVKKTLLNLYLQYELVTCIYMFEPWEKRLINGLVALILALVVFSSCAYLPTYMQTLLQFITPLSINAKASSYAPILQADKLNIS